MPVQVFIKTLLAYENAHFIAILYGVLLLHNAPDSWYLNLAPTELYFPDEKHEVEVPQMRTER